MRLFERISAGRLKGIGRRLAAGVLAAVLGLTAGEYLGTELGMPVTVSAAGNKIAANKSYDIVLGNETKTFTFVMPAKGYFYYTVTPLKYIENGQVSNSTLWALRRTTMSVNYRVYEEAEWVAYGSPFRSGSYAFKKGTKINISLTDINSEENKAYYRLKVTVKKPANFEKENNSTRKTATKLTAGKTYTGISQQNDTDWWVFTAPSTGRYRISSVETRPEKLQEVKVYIGRKLISSKVMLSDQGWVKLMDRKLNKGAKVYVLLNHGSKDEFYKIKVQKK